MRSLLLRVFLSFWSIIVITIVVAATLGYIYAERARETLQSFEVSEAMLEASDALRENGRDGLAAWLESLPDGPCRRRSCWRSDVSAGHSRGRRPGVTRPT